MTERDEWHTAVIPGYKINQNGVIINQDTNEPVEAWEDAGELRVKLVRWEREYHGRIWPIMLKLYFYGLKPDDVQMHYRDGDCWNLSVDNLDPWIFSDSKGWYSPRINIDRSGLRRVQRQWGKKVEIIETGEIFNGVPDLAEHLGTINSAIYRVLSGLAKSYKGQHFRYIE